MRIVLVLGLILGLVPMFAVAGPWWEEELTSEKACKKAVKRHRSYVKYNLVQETVKVACYGPKANCYQIYHFFGDLYSAGCPVADLARDKTEAAVWYERAAVGHVAAAQYKLGRMLIEGDGVETHEELGRHWLISAALEQHAPAVEFLKAARGIEITPPTGPTTYELMQQAFRNQVSAERRQMLGDASQFVLVAAGVYAAVQLGASVDRGQEIKPAPLQFARPAPVYCSSTATAFASGSESVAFVNATVTTFCH